jgi:predicted short-subunit dehydrogenase-like oxidoreductase (DUF2520 family)
MSPPLPGRRLAFIGAGRVGQTLARACSARGLAVVAVASRSAPAAAELAAELQAHVPGCRAMSAAAAVAAADLVFLTVADDAIASLAHGLPWRAGQAAVHCSGATELTALAAAAAAGAQVGGFHPLQIFSDPARAEQLLAGSTVAIEVAAGGQVLSDDLHALALCLQMRPLQLQPGTRAAYHGAASFAASFMLSMLDEAAQIWAQIGLPPEAALQALLPLARGTLDAAAARGLAGALSGPISRGDAGVVHAHLQALAGLGGEHGEFYRLIARRQLSLARASGRVDDATLQRLSRLLESGP